MKGWTRLYRYLFGLSPGATTLTLSAAAVQALTLIVTPILLGSTIAHLTGNSSVGRTIGWAIALIVTMLLAETAASLASMGSELVVRSAEKNLRLRSGYSFVKHPDLAAPESPDKNSLATRLDDSMWRFSNGCRIAITAFPSDVLALFGATIALGVVLSWPLALAMFTAVLVQSWVSTRSMAANLKAWGEDNEPQKHAVYAFEQGIGPAAKELRIFGLADWLIDRYQSNYLVAYQPHWRRRWKYLVPQVAAALLRVAVMVGALVWAANLTNQGRLSVGGFTSAIALIVAFGAISVWGASQMRGALSRLDWLEELSPPQDTQTIRRVEVGEVTAPPIPPGNAPQIVFDEVSFAYPGQDHLVLKDLTWELPAGQATALVGVNGAGKSTLVKMLTGGYRPTRGQILADGVDLASLDEDELAGWQRRLAPITQDFLHLPLSAGDNVELGAGQLWSGIRGVHDAAERAELDSLATRAGLTDLIDQLPRGWDTILDKTFEGGTDLSGGEWQRIGLARALRAVDAGAGLLILDEPAAALDVESEARLVTSYLDLAAKATSLLISHRFSVVRPVPAICVLSGGRITEQGTHAELMARGGDYARLFTLQAERYADDTVTEDELGEDL